MKNFKYIIASLTGAFLIFSCQDDDAKFGNVTAPSNLIINAEVIGVDSENPFGDGTGFVDFTFSADNALSYNIEFGDGLGEVVNSGAIRHRYSITGVNTYTVILNAVGTGGLTSSTSIEVQVFSSFDDLEAKELLSGGSSKTWYWAAAEPGHLGVGPINSSISEGYWYPQFYAAQPFEKAGDPQSSCIYEDEMTFFLDANQQLTYQLNNNGQTFFNGAHSAVGGGAGSGDDVCLEFDTSVTSIVSLSPTLIDWSTVPDPEFSSRGTVMNFSDNNFMGYYVGSSSYEIIQLTNTRMVVRTADALNSALAWYHTFSTSPPTEDFESDYNDLVWEDNFDANGAPNPANWTYDLGAGGWGNNESQTYTNSSNNVTVEDGFLKITAISTGGGNYTSSRIKSENLFEFTYGRVEVRAKLPTGGGTWPAIWMLGANFDTVSWPACGEIDIMEHVGNNQDQVHGTLHYPGNSGGNANGASTNVPNASTEFHNYTVDWSPSAIRILVDDQVYFTFANTPSTPFNSDFFLILNVAMGGNFGGAIDPNFTQSTLEIDYVRVYQ